MRRTLALLVLAVGLASGLAACAPAADPVALGDGAVIIDVRTPGEYAAGHLDGAVNIDVQAADFDARVGALEAEGEYYVYCRTGSRAAQAIERMTALGFTDLTNGGGLESASSATGIPIVTG